MVRKAFLIFVWFVVFFLVFVRNAKLVHPLHVNWIQPEEESNGDSRYHARTVYLSTTRESNTECYVACEAGVPSESFIRILITAK